MNELKRFLERLGGLHDAVLVQMVWSADLHTLRLEFEDLCANFKGLPEYPGAVPGAIELLGADRVTFDIDSEEKRLHVADFIVEADGGLAHRAVVSFWPGGRISAECSNAAFPEIRLREPKG
jgi:hypothetical protein